MSACIFPICILYTYPLSLCFSFFSYILLFPSWSHAIKQTLLIFGLAGSLNFISWTHLVSFKPWLFWHSLQLRYKQAGLLMVMAEPLICLIVCSCLGSRGLIGWTREGETREGERERRRRRRGDIRERESERGRDWVIKALKTSFACLCARSASNTAIRPQLQIWTTQEGLWGGSGVRMWPWRVGITDPWD